MTLICKDCGGEIIIKHYVKHDSRNALYKHKTWPAGFCRRKGRIKAKVKVRD